MKQSTEQRVVTPSIGPPRRGRYAGVMNIIRFNSPRYVCALGAFATGVVLASVVSSPWIRWPALISASLAGGWTLASLVVSHHIYDCSRLFDPDLYRELMSAQPIRWLSVHCGFDEMSPVLRRAFPAAAPTVVDIFSPRQMTEASIHRARNHARRIRATGLVPADEPTAISADSESLPLNDSTIDAVFLILAAHELRRPPERLQFFRELRRVMRIDGVLILVEHLRDGLNFAAFGPGFTHFFSRRSWLRIAEEVGFELLDERPITPFLRCIRWTRGSVNKCHSEPSIRSGNTESMGDSRMGDHRGQSAGPCVLYDGECGVCACGARWAERRLGPRGFQFSSMSEAWVRERLGLGESQVATEMKVITAGGQILGGVEAVLHLASHIGWLRPVARVASRRMFRPLLRWCYARIAQNRYRFGGICRDRGHPS